MKLATFSNKPTPGKSSKKGFTMVEMIVVIGVVIILVAIAYAALGDSKSDSAQTGAEATAKTLNDAITRAKLAGDDDPRIVGEDADDIEAAVQYLQSKGYID